MASPFPGNAGENQRAPLTFGELSGLLCTLRAEDTPSWAPFWAAVIPELEPLIGFDQKSPHHAYDLMTHTGLVVGRVPPEPVVRWAALLHDVGKVPTFTQDATGRGHFYGHAQASAAMAERILLRLQAPEALRRQVVVLIENHMTRPVADMDFLRRQLKALGRPTFMQLLELQRADMSGKSPEGAPEDDTRICLLLDALQKEGL